MSEVQLWIAASTQSEAEHYLNARAPGWAGTLVQQHTCFIFIGTVPDEDEIARWYDTTHLNVRPVWNPGSLMAWNRSLFSHMEDEHENEQ